MKDFTLLINRAAVPEWYFMKEPFTLDAHIKKNRYVVKWRKKKFVVRDPWTHIALVVDKGKTTHYVNGIKQKETKAKSPIECYETLTGTKDIRYLDELRVSSIAREQHV